MRQRIAWFSPMPPVRSGVAACSADLVRGLSGSYDIDVFVDDGAAAAIEGPARVRPAHDFVWSHRLHPYGLVIYQLGNSAVHEYMWPYLFRFPGLVVLHDARLHHARAAALLRAGRERDYRAEFAASHPGVDAGLAELAVKGFDSQMYYAWPMTRLVVRSSRAVAVHAASLAEELRQENPGACVETVRLGHGPQDYAADGSASRARWGIPRQAVVFGCFGGLSPEKRVPEILQAFAWLRARQTDVHLLLAGAAVDPDRLRAQVEDLGLRGATTVAGYLDRDDDLDACIAATDVALTLRWPTAREVSGPWLRCLGLGRPTVMVQLTHLSHVPALDPRDWRPTGSAGLGAEVAPVAVAIDILDEQHSLRLAMARLAADAALRASLGRAARQYWEAHHTVDGMVDDYRRVIPRVPERPAAAGDLPSHLINDGGDRVRALLAPFNLENPLR